MVNKIQVLFDQLLQASTLIKENQRSWTDFYNLIRAIYTSYCEEEFNLAIETGNESTEIFKTINQLSRVVTQYNANVDALWEVTTLFEPKARTELSSYNPIRSLKEALSFYLECIQEGRYAGHAMIRWLPVHQFREIREIQAEIRQLKSSTLNLEHEPGAQAEPPDLERTNISPIKPIETTEEIILEDTSPNRIDSETGLMKDPFFKPVLARVQEFQQKSPSPPFESVSPRLRIPR